MSTYGGDSWAREAQNRKRRVDDLVIEGVEASAYKKLSSGKFACLVCPNNPVLDTPIMLSAHVNGSRHRSAELKRKDRELVIQQEVNKRLALSDCVNSSKASVKQRKATIKPLIERARKAASEVFSSEVTQPVVKPETSYLVVKPSCEDCTSNGNSVEIEALDHRERRERELKFTAAGWKRDSHGRWFKDDNVEFDSDEEDPNIVLKLNHTT